MHKIFIILLLALCATLTAQDPYYEVFNIQDGLPSNEVYDIHIDSNNIVWGTSDRGVFTYDGFEIKSYNTSHGLSFNTNFQIIDDKKGKIWFTGYDGSLSYYQNGQFHACINNPALRKTINNTYHYNIAYDSLGNLYTHQIRLFVQEQPLNYFQLHDNGTIESMPMDFDTLAYVAEDGFHVLEKKMEGYSFFLTPELKIYPDNITTSDGEVHYLAFKIQPSLAVDNNPNSVFNEASSIYKIENGIGQVVYTSENSIHHIFIDQQNNILVGTEGGILVFENGDFSKPPKKSLPDYFISKINQDREGNYWLATLKNGMIKVPTFNLKIANIPNSSPPILNLTPFQKRLFYSSAYDCIAYLDLDLKSYPIKDCNTNQRYYHLNLINDSIITSKSFINPKENYPTLIQSYSPHHIGQNISHLYNNVYFGTGVHGYSISTPSDLLFYTSVKGPNVLKRINCVSNGPKKLWMGTLDGLYYFYKNDYKNYFKNEHPLMNIRINDVFTVSNNRLWVATVGNGLLHYSEEQIIKISSNEGLASDMVNCIFIESDSLIWAGTNKGLSKIYLEYQSDTLIVKDIINITNNDGLPSIFINDICKWNDDIWVATNGGLFGIPSSFSLPTQQAPSTYIKYLKIDNEEEELHDGVVLNYNQNNGVIHFNGISYRKPTENFFRYKLELNDNKGAYILTDDHSFRLTNIKPGAYKFSVQSRNKFNVWSEPEELNFEIKPHFTQTWWFLGLLILGVIGFVLFLFKKRILYLQSKQKHKTKLSEAILRTEIAELSTFRNQFNPHFVFNSLNSIQNYIFDKDLEEANFFLSKFSKLIRSSLHLSEQKHISLNQEFQFIKDYLDIEFLRFPDKFDYQFVNKDDLSLDSLLIPPLILQPIIENVIKHAFNNMDSGSLVITLKELNTKQIKITITDNGKGIQEDDAAQNQDKRNSYGIKIVQDRIALLNLEIPDLPSSFNILKNPNEKGTVVEFVLPKIET